MDRKANALEALDRADFFLAGMTLRDGCVYKLPIDQCDICSPIISARKSIIDAWAVLDGGVPWWDQKPQKRYDNGPTTEA